MPEFMVEIKEKIKSVAFVNIAQILDAKMPSDCVFQGNYAAAPTTAANMLSGAEAGGMLNSTEPLDEATIYWKRAQPRLLHSPAGSSDRSNVLCGQALGRNSSCSGASSASVA